MKKLAPVFVALIAAALAIWLLVLKKQDPAPAPAATGSGSSATAAPAAHDIKRIYDHAQKVSPDEHRQLADDIAKAHAARAGSHSAPAAPKLPEHDSSDDLARVQEHVQDALKQAIPFLADCYTAHGSDKYKGGLTATAQMTLTGDPDIGTVIDADQIYDDKHQPLDKALDDCLRNTMQTLALPPLDTGDRVRIEYSFRFGD